MERAKAYLLNLEDLAIEKGEGANLEEILKQADLISAKWDLPGSKPDKPLLLMIGGFQGSGKTTALNILAPKLNLIIISPDEIRHNLFEQNYPFSEDFVRLVNATKFELVKRALDLGISIAVDQSLTPDRVSLTKEISSAYPNFTVKSIFLAAPAKVLKNRVGKRVKLDGVYKGTLPELEASIKKYAEVYGKPNKNDYDLIVDSSKEKPEFIAEFVIKHVIA